MQLKSVSIWNIMRNEVFYISQKNYKNIPPSKAQFSCFFIKFCILSIIQILNVLVNLH